MRLQHEEFCIGAEKSAQTVAKRVAFKADRKEGLVLRAFSAARSARAEAAAEAQSRVRLWQDDTRAPNGPEDVLHRFIKVHSSGSQSL
jgi:hypothetical protein